VSDPVLDAYRRIVDAFKAGCFEDALAECQALLISRPSDAQILFLGGAAARQLALTETWVDLFERTVALDPAQTDAHFDLGIGYRILGQREKAEAAFEQVLALNPNHAAAYYQLSQLRGMDVGERHKSVMHGMLDDPSTPPADAVQLCFALAKAHEDDASYDDAFQFMTRGNDLKRSLIDYDITRDEAFAARIAATFTPDLVDHLSNHGHPSKTPVFIIGMPRAGTTLVEQILASHSGVVGLGEILDLEQAVVEFDEQSGSMFPEFMQTISPEALAGLGAAYAGRIEAMAPGVSGAAPGSIGRVVNKTPANFLYAGLIALALPDARIIHCRRDAMDTCFSCFATLFEAGPYFSYDLEELARYYKIYSVLMRLWHERFPGRILDVNYENLVADQTHETKRVLEYCGLDWQDACMSFHNSSRPVTTASNLQVRQPLYGNAVGRWQRFEKHLASLRELIA
jgi:tetratricopeptide (TPR) repeat protein